MTTSTEYLPEWKLYLWKKLLIDAEGLAKHPLHLSDFQYVDSERQRNEMGNETQTSINMVEAAYLEALRTGNFTALRKREQPHRHGDAWYFFQPLGIAMTLLELAKDEPPAIQLQDVTLSSDYIETYRTKRKEYEALLYRKMVASSGGGQRPEEASGWKRHLADKFCGLGGNIYRKAKGEQPLDLQEVQRVIALNTGISPLDFLSFRLTVLKPQLEAKLNDYIDAFIRGDLVPPQGVRYFGASQQADHFFISLRYITTSYGYKNLAITLEELARAGGWHLSQEPYHRFYETMFALERKGLIRISELRTNGIICSITPLGEKLFLQTEEEERRRARSRYANAQETGADEKPTVLPTTPYRAIPTSDTKNPYQPLIEVIDILLRKIAIEPKNRLTGNGIKIHTTETTLPHNDLGSDELAKILNTLKQAGAFDGVHRVGASFAISSPNKEALLKKRAEWIANGNSIERQESIRVPVLPSRPPSAAQETSDTKESPQRNRPHCFVKKGLGFLKFGERGEEVRIGQAYAQPFRLLQCMTEPSFGIAKTVDTVFEAVRENVRSKSKAGVLTQTMDRAQKVKIIKYVIKELQKENKLRGKIQFKFDELKTKLLLEYSD